LQITAAKGHTHSGAGVKSLMPDTVDCHEVMPNAADTRGMRKTVAATGLGAALALGGVAAFDTGRYLLHSMPASTASVEKPLVGFTVDPDWVRSGQPNFRASETVRSPDGQTISGLWACDGPSVFEWTFGLDETVHLLEGQIEVDYQGRHFTLRPGDTASFLAGTRSVWRVPEHAKKAFTLHRPGRLVLLWRRLAASFE
jgi:uncharacterized protein